jgi:hypothetical protein
MASFFLSSIQISSSGLLNPLMSSLLPSSYSSSKHVSFFLEKQKKENSQNPESKPNPKPKKLITISPGGVQGFYLAGICCYLKDHHTLDDYHFSGASAGAWNALACTYKGNMTTLYKRLLESTTLQTSQTNSLFTLENSLKKKILEHYKTTDFDLERLSIGITVFEKCKPTLLIVSQFTDLEDALDACIASSHIPFITGGLFNRYRGKITLDGGFSKDPYLYYPSNLHITPSMFLPGKKKHIVLSTLLSLLPGSKKVNYKELMEQGYHDARKEGLHL